MWGEIGNVSSLKVMWSFADKGDEKISDTFLNKRRFLTNQNGRETGMMKDFSDY
jgi:hypothetical protein